MNGSGNNPRMAIDPSKNRMPSGLRLVWEKKYSKAAKSFTEYMDDEDADLSNFEKAKVLCNRAWCYLKLGRSRQCLTDIDSALELASRNQIPQSIGLQIKALLHLGRQKEARKIFESTTKELEDSADFASIEYLGSVVYGVDEEDAPETQPHSQTQQQNSPDVTNATGSVLNTTGPTVASPGTETKSYTSLVDEALDGIENGKLSLPTDGPSSDVVSSTSQASRSGKGELRDRNSVEASFMRLPDPPAEVYQAIDNPNQLPEIKLKYSIGFANKKLADGDTMEAMRIYDLILDVAPQLVDALIGAASAKAYLGELFDALNYANKAVRNCPDSPTAYKIRAQLLNATGSHTDGIRDINKAIDLATNNTTTAEQYSERPEDLYSIRAQMYSDSKQEKKALLDAITVCKIVPRTNPAWVLLGRTLANLGILQESHRILNKLSIDMPENQEVYAAWAHCMREFGHEQQTEALYKKLLTTKEPRLFYKLRFADFYYFSGSTKNAMTLYREILEASPQANERPHCLLMEANCLHGLGYLKDAVQRYDESFSLNPDQPGLSHRDLAIYQTNFSNFCPHPCFKRDYLTGLIPAGEMPLDVKGLTQAFHVNLDAKVPSNVKESHSRRLSKNSVKQYPEIFDTYPTLSYQEPPMAVDESRLDEVRQTWNGLLNMFPTTESHTVGDAVERLKSVADSIGSFMQYQSPGFLKNSRQHRQFGCAALELSQVLRSHWISLCNGASGVYCHNDSSSNLEELKSLLDSNDFDDNDCHALCYRDVFDIALLWRQNSEPFDPVYWIEGLTKSTFERGFGLQTPMVSGFTEVPRYFPYCGRALAITKRLACEQYPMTEQLKAQVMGARSVIELHKIMGRDFWVITPCYRRESLETLHSFESNALSVDLSDDPCVKNLPHTLIDEPEAMRWLEGIKPADVLNKLVLPDVSEETFKKGKELHFPSQSYNMYHAQTMAFSDELGGQAVPTESVGDILQGTRLTVQEHGEEGIYYSIRMPLTPIRMREYGRELQSIWKEIVSVMQQPALDAASVQTAKELFLSFYYYWVVLAPLTRGSSAVGLCVFIGLSLAAGFDLNLPFPPGFQLDWEAILSTDPWSFINRVEDVVYTSKGDDSNEHTLSAHTRSHTCVGYINPSNYPPMAEFATTIGDVLEFLRV